MDYDQTCIGYNYFVFITEATPLSYLGISLSLSLSLSQNVKQGPKSHHSTVWKSQRDKHLPSVTKFDPPEDFLDQLNAQVYGPSTQLIKSNVCYLVKVANFISIRESTREK